MVKSADARNSVFDVPKPTKQKSQPKAEVTSSRQTTARSPGFACALTSDGSLVLIREGQIEFSLSGAEAATLQSYLVKRAAANLFASMA
jgi:3,4-dihydroxy-2-butanone 4-phosphate synthase